MSWTCGVCGHVHDRRPSGGSVPEVLEAVNRARAERGDPPLTRGMGFHDDPRSCHECGRFPSRVYTYAWGNNERRAQLKGRRCVIEASGSKNTVLVRFLDTDERVTTSRRALR